MDSWGVLLDLLSQVRGIWPATHARSRSRAGRLALASIANCSSATPPSWPKGSARNLGRLGACCLPAPQVSMPRREDYDARVAVLEEVQQVLERGGLGVEQLRVEPYGSFVSGFYNASSDLDIALTGYRRWDELPPKVRQDVASRLPAVPEYVALVSGVGCRGGGMAVAVAAGGGTGVAGAGSTRRGVHGVLWRAALRCWVHAGITAAAAAKRHKGPTGRVLVAKTGEWQHQVRPWRGGVQ